MLRRFLRHFFILAKNVRESYQKTNKLSAKRRRLELRVFPYELEIVASFQRVVVHLARNFTLAQ